VIRLNEEIADKVKDIITDIAPDEATVLEDLDYAGPLREQIGLDSMDFLDIMMELRKRYKIDVPEDDYEKFLTMNSTVDYLEPLMG